MWGMNYHNMILCPCGIYQLLLCVAAANSGVYYAQTYGFMRVKVPVTLPIPRETTASIQVELQGQIRKEVAQSSPQKVLPLKWQEVVCTMFVASTPGGGGWSTASSLQDWAVLPAYILFFFYVEIIMLELYHLGEPFAALHGNLSAML
jgi:hypothetical protein